MAKCSYNPDLRYKLPANNDRSDVVLNRAFKDYADHIAANLSMRTPAGGIRYEIGRDRKLLALCIDHAIAHKKPTEGGIIVMLTHPFYLHLSHMEEVDNDCIRREASEYLDTLLDFLKINHYRHTAGVVVLETLHHYAAATSLLLEAGLIDRVIFTYYNKGCPLDTRELNEFRKKLIYFAGGYNNHCLSRSIQEMKAKASPENIWAISDLVLNSPQNNSITLRTSKVAGMDASRVIPLEEVVRRLHLES